MLNTLANIKTINPKYKLNLNKNVFPENWIPPIREENALVNRRMNYLTENEIKNKEKKCKGLMKLKELNN